MSLAAMLQEQQQEAAALEKAGRVMRNLKLAAAWRGWQDRLQQRHYLQAKLGAAVNLFTDRRLAMAWQAWQVGPDYTSCLSRFDACFPSLGKAPYAGLHTPVYPCGASWEDTERAAW